ncbi:MAG TPA: serine/threonine-protein kinase [Drouetiella sp.]
MANEKILLYGDRWSAAALWAKAFFLLPLWAFLLLPLFGWVTSRFGNFAFQAGYPVLLVIGLIYFVDDVLRRKIKIDDNYVHLGFNKYKLSELSSVGLIYSQNGITPVSLLLYFGAGKKLPLSLDRLQFKDFERLLNLIENRVPHCEIDPVVQTLSKTKKLARKASLDESDRTEISYHSRRLLRQVTETFLETAQSWSRLGPILTLLLTTPMWLTMVKTVYSVPLSPYSPEAQIALQEQLVDFVVLVEKSLGQVLADGAGAALNLVSNPYVASICCAVLVPIFYHFLRLLCLPNKLVLDATGPQLRLKAGQIDIPLVKASWDSITNARLGKPKLSAGPDHWQISLTGQNGAIRMNLDLAALTPEDRTRLSRALERWAPHCAIDTALMETLMPRQANSYTELWLQSLAAPPERASLEPLCAGRVLKDGQFEVERRIGVGGQGAAYLCVEHLNDSEHSRNRVVLKETIIPVFVEAEIRKQALERFEQEARILRDLDNEHIVKLLDYFVEDHRGYLVLEWVDGKSLRQIIEDRGSMQEEQVKNLCEQMCEMLDYLHSRNIIHRDFTPDNLILQKDGKLKLIDFNVAQTDEEGSGLIVGKQAYMPAEQFRGKPTAQSDIYAMGATLFFLLTGQDPEPISRSVVREVNATVSDTIDGIIQKCTEADCEKRFKSVQDVSNALKGEGFVAVAVETIQIVEVSETLESKNSIPSESGNGDGNGNGKSHGGSNGNAEASSNGTNGNGNDNGEISSNGTNGNGNGNGHSEEKHTIKIDVVEKEAIRIDA